MTHASVFSGIGGPEVAATMLGWENLFHCEINPFGRTVLDYWYPHSKSYDDITKTDFREWRGKVDVLTGGFPCQPFSYAGKRGGAQDDRYLWPHMHRCINEVRPRWVVAENVAGILTMVEQGEVTDMASQATLFGEADSLRGYQLRETFTLQRICDDLESNGYTVQPVLIPACAVGAPHRRDRVFIVGCRNDAFSENSLYGGFLYGQYEKQRSERNKRHAGTGNRERLCGETSGTAFADTCSGGQSAPEQQGDRAGQTIQRESREQSQHGTERSGIPSAFADTDCNGHQSQAESGRPETSGRSDNGEPCQRSEPTEWSERFYSLLRNHADTSEQCGSQIEFRQSQTGRKTQGKSGGGSGEDGSGRIAPHSNSNRRCEMDEYMESELADGAKTVSNGGQRNVANTDNERLERRDQSGSEESWQRLHLRRYIAGHGDEGGEEREYQVGERWQNFPSVSPVHRGDDGLPFPVDDLTIPFGNWRTESLKAYGNAIVVQVMYEIFRAIQITEESWNDGKK